MSKTPTLVGKAKNVDGSGEDIEVTGCFMKTLYMRPDGFFEVEGYFMSARPPHFFLGSRHKYLQLSIDAGHKVLADVLCVNIEWSLEPGARESPTQSTKVMFRGKTDFTPFD